VVVAERRAGIAVHIATCAGVGYFPIAPGTAGSLVGVVIVAAVGRAPFSTGGASAILASLATGIFAVGVWAAGHAEKYFGRVDPGAVVIDEVVGQIITFLAYPGATWKWLIAGFLAFRVFDVVKPFPARRAEQVAGGWGIMLDDLAAGVYSLATMALMRSVLKWG